MEYYNEVFTFQDFFLYHNRQSGSQKLLHHKNDDDYCWQKGWFDIYSSFSFCINSYFSLRLDGVWVNNSTHYMWKYIEDEDNSEKYADN